MRRTLGRIGRLTLLAASGPQAWVGLFMFGTVLTLQFVDLWVDIQMIAWTKRFYDALEQVDATTAIRELGVFFCIVAASVGLYLISDYLRKRLWLRWRTELTQKALNAWLGGQAYWHLRPGLSPEAIDNPDQRIAEDCKIYVELLLQETLDLIGRAVGLVTYVVILWNISDFLLEFTVLGIGFSIPHYMVWLAFLYVLLSSIITHLMGRPLKSLFFRQERHEADFRHALVQIRDNATEIAQAGGETAERRRLTTRYEGIRQNWFRLIGQEFFLGLFTRPYYQTILRIPLFFALPAFFAGAVTFGGLMQLSSAFGRVTQTLSWFIFSYKDLANFAAVAHRLDDLFAQTRNPEPMAGAPCAINHGPSDDGALHIQGLRLATPYGRWLSAVPDRVVTPGERIWISGDSGQGKTTLLSAITGLWQYGEGRIGRPDVKMVALPQRPHLFPEGLAATASYPRDPADIPTDRLRSILERLGLDHRLPMLDAAGEASLEGLSLGERQRLAFARILLHQPDLVLLDEATSSLDATSEAHLLSLLRKELPNATILCVAHRMPTALEPTDTWYIGQATQTERKSA
ncbi:ABC transporter ATP-binding protein/permease [Puniceibacterium sediminis]|uniref:Endopeptidase Clp n=1 Tax=Puniceibacterium sediminis TaxID=1608407 RepID=A0A238Y8M1_9RHOB|nr:SbmA/BacA-like family transporter [Puniceibacterium sediminis]SNR66689.1 putative ATP-binding cassette transporter [Puniceibacterium sediminis]